MTGLGNGQKHSMDVVQYLLVLHRLNQELELWVLQENEWLRGDSMREVKELAAGMKEVMASLRKSSADAKSEFMSEVERAKINAQKVKAVAGELRDANKEVEDFLGETGSNFPPSEGSSTPAPPSGKPDVNGVIKNTESTQ